MFAAKSGFFTSSLALSYNNKMFTIKISVHVCLSNAIFKIDSRNPACV